MANFNKAKKLHFIYKTTNLINGRYYIGMHSTNNVKDGYLGSGKQLRAAIRKYGEENFQVEILEYLPDRSSLALREKEIVNETLLKDPQCMNLKEGGNGGFSTEDAKKGRYKTNQILEEKYGKDYSKFINKRWRNSLTNEDKIKLSKKISEGFKRVNHNHATFKGKNHTEETKMKMSLSSKGKSNGEKNSQYGTCWIHHLDKKLSKKIKKEELEYYLSEGWIKGRKIKFIG